MLSRYQSMVNWSLVTANEIMIHCHDQLRRQGLNLYETCMKTLQVWNCYVISQWSQNATNSCILWIYFYVCSRVFIFSLFYVPFLLEEFCIFDAGLKTHHMSFVAIFIQSCSPAVSYFKIFFQNPDIFFLIEVILVWLGQSWQVRKCNQKF